MTVTLHGRRDFADAVKDFGMGRLAWIIQVGPKCHHKCPYKEEAKGDLTPPEGKTML